MCLSDVTSPAPSLNVVIKNLL